MSGSGGLRQRASAWPDTRIQDMIGLDHPILQAPMAGSSTAELAIAVAEAGGLGSLACAMLGPDALREEVAKIRAATGRPLNLNFFCHVPAPSDPARDASWALRVRPYLVERGLDPGASVSAPNRAPFDERLCEAVEEIRPRVASFHFGLPPDALLRRVRDAGCLVISSATTVAEARWLAERGVDAVIAQGAEAGGHRGMFLSQDVTAQPGTFALVPQVVDAVQVPVIAAGGIADGRGIVAALALGAAAVQIGTAYLFCPECRISQVYRTALGRAEDDSTVLTNVLTGRPARGILNRFMRELGPLDPEAPAFPGAAAPLAPLRKDAEAQGSGDFSPLWAGQAVALGRALAGRGGAAALTGALAADALRRIGSRLA